MIPDNIKKYAARKGILSTVKKVDLWVKKSGKHISGGTAIGKNYDTLILDLTYQGGEIRINANTKEIQLFDEHVSDYKEFNKLLEGHK